MNRKSAFSVDRIRFLLSRKKILSLRFAILLICVNVVRVELDDIDHLGNRRVRLVGELLTNQIYIILLRIERIVRASERLGNSRVTRRVDAVRFLEC